MHAPGERVRNTPRLASLRTRRAGKPDRHLSDRPRPRSPQLAALILAHAIAALGFGFARRLGPRAMLIGALPTGATFVWLLTKLSTVLDGGVVRDEITWVEPLGLDLSLRLDAYAWVMASLVSGVGVLVFVYASSYFGERAGLTRLGGTLTTFAGAMLGLVLADGVLGLFVFWELTSITSYLLVGTDDAKAEARAAARQALVITSSGALALLAGLVILGQGAGNYSISAILENPPTGAAATTAAFLVLIGAATKSAQLPFHAWLPGAMAAPTPISAYLHSATMVKAGVYLIGRVAPAFAATYAGWRPTVVALGAVTMFVGGSIALRQTDLKRLLAYGTISQLGFMMLLLGAGIPELTFAGTALLLAHGMFKSSLFLVAGIVDHQAHSRDIRRLTGMGRLLPVTAIAGTTAAVSMAGIPPLFGFVSKEVALDATWTYLPGQAELTAVAIVVGSALTLAYGARFVYGAFATKRPGELDGDPVDTATRPHPVLVAAAVIPAAAGLVFGLVPLQLESLVLEATASLGPEVDKHLALWTGVKPALWLSVAAITGGAVVWSAWRVLETRASRLRLPLDAGRVFELTMNGVSRVATRTAAFSQSGALPVYLSIILMTAVVVPTTALVDAPFPDDLTFAENGIQVIAASIAMAAALGAAIATRRFVAVMALGAVGFAVAVLFLVQGAPDLALTQFLVETLSVVLFVLVLRHLPERFRSSPFTSQPVLRAAVAASVGIFVTFFVLIAGGARTADPVSDRQIERALPDGGGRNVVNVILTDIRALDTLGEITVLAVTAVGIASLVIAVRRDRAAEREPLR